VSLRLLPTSTASTSFLRLLAKPRTNQILFGLRAQGVENTEEKKLKF
jgi:hypothetical protein